MKHSLPYQLLFISAYQLLRLVPVEKASFTLNGLTASSVVSVIFSSSLLSILTNIFVFLFFRSYLQLQFRLYPDAIVDYAAFWGVILLVNYANTQQHALEYFCFVCTCTVSYGLFKRSNIDYKIWALYSVIIMAFHSLYLWSAMSVDPSHHITYILSTIILTLYLLKDIKFTKRLPVVAIILCVCWLLANSIFERTFIVSASQGTFKFFLDSVKGANRVKARDILENVIAINRLSMQSLSSLLWNTDAALLLKSDLQLLTPLLFPSSSTPTPPTPATPQPPPSKVSFSFTPKIVKTAQSAAATQSSPTLAQVYVYVDYVTTITPHLVYILASLAALGLLVYSLIYKAPKHTATPSPSPMKSPSKTPSPAPSHTHVMYLEHVYIWLTYIAIHVHPALLMAAGSSADSPAGHVQTWFFICLVLVQWLANSFVSPAISSTAARTHTLTLCSRPPQPTMASMYSKQTYQVQIPSSYPYQTYIHYMLQIWVLVNVGAVAHKMVQGWRGG